MLQALLSLQAYTGDLRIFVKDSDNGTRETWNIEILLSTKY